MVIDTLQAADRAASTVATLATRLKQQIDSARRGAAVDPRQTLDALLDEARFIKKELARAA